MMAEGGVSQLDGKQLASAEKSYAAWAEARPRLAARHDFADKAYSAASGSINILYVTGLAARAMVKSELKAA